MINNRYSVTNNQSLIIDNQESISIISNQCSGPVYYKNDTRPVVVIAIFGDQHKFH